MLEVVGGALPVGAMDVDLGRWSMVLLLGQLELSDKLLVGFDHLLHCFRVDLWAHLRHLCLETCVDLLELVQLADLEIQFGLHLVDEGRLWDCLVEF